MSGLGRRLRRKRVLIPLGFLALVAGALAWLLATTPGARWAIGFGAGKAPGATITVDRIEGRLLGPLHLHGIRVRNPLTETRVGHLELDWSETRLFSRTLHVRRLVVEDVTVSLLPPPAAPPPPPEEAAEPFAPPPPVELPIQVVVDEARITGVHIVTGQGLDVEDLQLGLGGTLDAYHLTLAARVIPETAPPAELALDATGSLSAIAVDALTLRTLNGEATVRARAAWYPEVAWAVDAAVDRVEPGLLAPDPASWPGWVSAALRTEGKLDARGQPAGWASLDTLSGEFRGEALGGSLRAAWTDLEHVTADVNLAWAGVALRAAASLADSIRLDLDLACPDLGVLAPGVGGAVRLDARVQGMLDAPRVDADLVAERVIAAAGSLTVSRADLRLEARAEGIRAVLDAARDSTAAPPPLPGLEAELDVRVDSTAFGSVALDSTTFRFWGGLREHRVRLDAFGPLAVAAVELSGGLDAATRVWTGRLDSLRFVNAESGPWALCRPAGIQAGPGTASVDSLCLGREGAAVRLDAAFADSQWTAAVAVADLPLAWYARGLPPGHAVRGTLGLDLEASGDAAGGYALHAEAGLDGARYVFTLEEVPDSVSLDPVRITVDGGAGGLAAAVEAVMDGTGPAMHAEFRAEASLPEYASLRDSLPAEPVTATVRGGIPDLSLLNAFDARVRDARGSLELAFDAAGTVAEPMLSGAMKVVDAGVSLPDLGLRVTGVQLAAGGDMASGFTVTGSARSGEGDLAIDGVIPAEPALDRPVTVTIRGERFQLVDTAEMQAVASPDLSLVYDTEKLTVSGKVVLPVVRVELVEMPPSAVAPSPDVVLVDEAAEPAALPVDTWVDVEVVLGDEVEFRGFALSVQLAGALRVRQHVPDPPSGHGQILIPEGYYRAYGQNLTIEDGVVSFAGPLENPALNIRAFRVAPDDVIAGIHITGTAENPQLEVYSEPAMQQSQAVSYLVTGRPLQEGGAGSNLGGAAALLGSNVLSSQLGSRIGLDEARVETGGDIDEASLVAGKYLSPKIYISYAMGLFDRSNLIRVRYIFSRKWAVQGETGTTMGTDVFYKIERGGNE